LGYAKTFLHFIRGKRAVKGSIIIDQERCKGCTFCIEFCPKGAIVLSGTLNLKGYFVAQFIDEKGCTGCATCAVVCPEVAVEVYKN
jgi:2-oxoglutarate ferredoxin oxidoreductase subunit delta